MPDLSTLVTFSAARVVLLVISGPAALWAIATTTYIGLGLFAGLSGSGSKQ